MNNQILEKNKQKALDNSKELEYFYSSSLFHHEMYKKKAMIKRENRGY